ncbi:hypothetical protein P4O66_000861 [Electrophorus voltai]|uniref:Uncharacterized protein n=1 Tax=Electrophorus voltai TaxID=2609070 RepID=A0AAD8ZHD5_9TELE|nr:hypothetical protein P4O66_000861 [Electrophorus voltai]
MSADESLANELSTFFACFEATSSSANANSANANSANAYANNANGAIGAANGACAKPTIEERPLIITESDVRRVNTRKSKYQEGGGTRWYLRESPQSLRRPASPSIHRHLQSLSDAQYRPIQLQAFHHRPRPKETSTLWPQ